MKNTVQYSYYINITRRPSGWFTAGGIFFLGGGREDMKS